jgi:hypothetical protein
MKIKIILLLITIFLISCNEDIENVTIEGYVYTTNSKKAIPNQTLYLVNYYYEGGDYDAYGNDEVHKIITDEKGYYKIYLRKSAYVQLDIVNNKTSGTTIFFIDKYIYKPKIHLDFYR